LETSDGSFLEPRLQRVTNAFADQQIPLTSGEYAVHCFVNDPDTFPDLGFANGIVSLPTKAGGHVRLLLPPAISASDAVIIAAWEETIRTQDWGVVQPYLLFPLATDDLSETLALSRAKLVTWCPAQETADNTRIRLVGKPDSAAILSSCSRNAPWRTGTASTCSRFSNAFTRPPSSALARLTSLFVFVTGLLTSPDHVPNQGARTLRRGER
jgi:hypothetical protein